MKNPQELEKALHGNFLTKLAIYTKMSGPGWVQAAVTLGGGSLVGALYLGVIGGYDFLWLQPLAMLCGIVMLSAIGYVTLSTDERPFRVMEKKVSPLLAWGWLVATVIADTVFCAAQFSLGRGALEDNLGVNANPYVITGSIFIIAMCLISLSQKNERASRLIDNILKLLVGIIVLSFMGVAITLLSTGAVPWKSIIAGYIPNFSALFRPTEHIAAAIAKTGEHAGYWTQYVMSQQRDKIIAAFGTAVGINMTFLLPYSLRNKGWGKEHRELSRFDLVLGLFLPFVLGISALVIASAASFHAQTKDVLTADGTPLPAMEKSYYSVLDRQIASTNSNFNNLADPEKQTLRNAAATSDKQLAAMLANRDAKNLAQSLEPFLGNKSQFIFGIGVLAMAVSTLLVHMIMNGYAISEALNRVGNPKVFILGASMPAIAGFLSPVLWDSGAKAALQIPAAVIATTLLPIAYLGFLLLMNSRSALGENLPKNRLFINLLMIISTALASFASIWALLSQKLPGYLGVAALIALAVIGILGFNKRNQAVR
ncbi:divalent metal cation transporter [Luteolibacter pohnpeiensis]|uniref:Divalent metal cation transporter n=1 Tax=Luteolibacter pohnpeiensis TaxID=454153 RepID=A0A934S3R5_9BACT|nr:divalent metal cation transporter [Luteolibacter pohnpeiensis]MBK1882625.1 divalent metal cation transporter [Luteolibacter pohnpeiensis]